ncbi:hypothetical protein HRG_005323 [Hirsutella rhossiliensis]|uniref:Uncharacterized protein n=1 Tax=Hirsutella rhossiliensis TaxID=111463 RepID=A0A9P8MV89_9HYPO|nr:uncharacterized protein HRG_05323 [Hirsutella rhossiliensis]KAH0962813.1 hypothetical protein HRG_05323 [Hirsutella rhossiliensis]
MASLADLCTTGHVQSALLTSLDSIDAASVQTSMNMTVSVGSEWVPDSTTHYCNVIFAYSHKGVADDVVHISSWVPAPDTFQYR